MTTHIHHLQIVWNVCVCVCVCVSIPVPVSISSSILTTCTLTLFVKTVVPVCLVKHW
eukprot:gnl/Chilomastix_caulleri/5593.p4 GENE.gnl/Chilomastix_caulleri/5593~~gnl/Chilomastix_caulleri/5593.p4  ORF type:complete len:57 (-),score=3.36 gnl/Chilomastix_caulleri/5593:226-396(-)